PVGDPFHDRLALKHDDFAALGVELLVVLDLPPDGADLLVELLDRALLLAVALAEVLDLPLDLLALSPLLLLAGDQVGEFLLKSVQHPLLPVRWNREQFTTAARS